MENNYFPGEGCVCHANSKAECGCFDVDWTPKEVYELREENEKLKKERNDYLEDAAHKELENYSLKKWNKDLKNNILDKLEVRLPKKKDTRPHKYQSHIFHQNPEYLSHNSCLQSVKALIKEIRES